MFVVQVVVVEGMNVETGALAVPVTSAGALGLPEQLGPSEFALVFRDMMASGSWNPEETGSSFWGRMQSGEACMEELVVKRDSGDMTGDPCCELEALEEALIADGGAAAGRCVPKFVWT